MENYFYQILYSNGRIKLYANVTEALARGACYFCLAEKDVLNVVSVAYGPMIPGMKVKRK